MKQSSITSFYHRALTTPLPAHSSHSHHDVSCKKTTSSAAAASSESAKHEELPVDSPMKRSRTAKKEDDDTKADTSTATESNLFASRSNKESSTSKARNSIPLCKTAKTSCRNGEPLSISSLRRMPDCFGHFPELTDTADHVVMFKKGTSLPADDEQPPRSLCWQADHVRLPCSPSFKRPGGGELFWSTMRYALTHTPVTSSQDLEDRMNTYLLRKRPIILKGMHHLFKTSTEQYRSEFFELTMPHIIELALDLPLLVTRPLPLLRRGTTRKITFTQRQVASLLANAFLCAFPRPQRDAEMNVINFSTLYYSNKRESSVHKLRTFLHYFDRLARGQVDARNHVTVERRCLSRDALPDWRMSRATFENALVVDDEGKIEDAGRGMLQVDFANEYIGGGTLGNGLVQEEIRFAICTQAVVSMLLCEKMDDNEAIFIKGVERFSDYSGYASTYKWTGDHTDDVPLDPWQRKCTYIVAIDAKEYNNRSSYQQFAMHCVERELMKAYVGFSSEPGEDPANMPAIATGNWGCGVFNGDPILKGLIQLMAAVCSGRQLCYFTWKDSELKNKLERVYQLMSSNRKVTVGYMWKLIERYSKLGEDGENFYSFVINNLQEFKRKVEGQSSCPFSDFLES